MNQSRLPLSLVIVAILFMGMGAFAAIDMIESLVHNRIKLNVGVLGFFIGPGLLDRRRGWRTCALVFIWIALLGVPPIVVAILLANGPLVLNVFGQQVGYASKATGIAIIAVVFAIALWKYRVLTRPDVRKLFGVGGA